MCSRLVRQCFGRNREHDPFWNCYGMFQSILVLKLVNVYWLAPNMMSTRIRNFVSARKQQIVHPYLNCKSSVLFIAYTTQYLPRTKQLRSTFWSKKEMGKLLWLKQKLGPMKILSKLLCCVVFVCDYWWAKQAMSR